MKKTNKTTKTSRLALAMLLPGLLLASNARAQLFGGTIKPSISVPASITLATDQRYTIMSVKDQYYTPYAAPTAAATTATNVTPTGNTGPDQLVDVQGSIPTTGISINIPVTATGSGTLPAYSSSVDIDPIYTEDGNGRTLTLSWPKQTVTSTTKYITATLSAVGGTLNAKKLDINAGIGSDYLGVLLGSIFYPYNKAGALTTLQVHDIAPIPDRMFGIADNKGSKTSHQFLYLPVIAEDGSVWLNNNLGADYANLNSPSFSPTTVVSSDGEYHSYGSVFEWGRKPDGHELVNWTGPNTGSFVTVGYSTTRVDVPTDTKFILISSTPFDWRVTPNNTLWSGGGAVNNPCPDGFHVPSAAEVAHVKALYYASSIPFVKGGMCGNHPGYSGYNIQVSSDYHLSDCSGTGINNDIGIMGLDYGSVYHHDNYMAYAVNYSIRTKGAAVRCIKN